MTADAAKDSLKQRGIRLTRQRQLLLDLLDKTGQHLDAENLYQLAHQQDPKLNRVTVYRTFKLLKEGGLVDELDLMHYTGDQHYLRDPHQAGARPRHLPALRQGGGVLRRTAAASCAARWKPTSASRS